MLRSLSFYSVIIYLFSCSNETWQRLFTPPDNVKNISTLNIVLDTDVRLKTALSKQNIVKDVWVFSFNGTLMGNVELPIKEYFTNFVNLSLKSTVYSHVITNGKHQLFEVYRVTPFSELTITLLCQLESHSHKVEFLNKKPVYERRNNLTDVHLRIGVIMENSLVSSDSTVKKISLKRYYW